MVDLTSGIPTPSIDLTQILMIVQFVFIGLLVLVAGYFVIKIFKHNIKVIVEERHEHGTFIKIKRARIGYDKKDTLKTVEMIFLLMEKSGYPLMPPTSVYKEAKEDLVKKGKKEGDITKGDMIEATQGWYKSLYGLTNRGKKVIRVVKEGNEYTVIPFTNDDVLDYLRVSKPVRMQWANNMLKQGMELFSDEPGFMGKYGTYVILGGTLIVVLLIFMFMFEKLDNINAYAQGLQDFAAATREHAQALRDVGVQPIK